jgi:hypothetical protein
VGGDEVEDVADVDHAERLVQRLAIDGEAGMTCCAKARQQLAERGACRRCHHVGARHHHVPDAHLVEGERVREQGALVRRELGLFGRLREHVLELVADGVARSQGEALHQSLEPALARLRVGTRPLVPSFVAHCAVVGPGQPEVSR